LAFGLWLLVHRSSLALDLSSGSARELLLRKGD